jgi:hypothetical protein
LLTTASHTAATGAAARPATAGPALPAATARQTLLAATRLALPARHVPLSVLRNSL